MENNLTGMRSADGLQIGERCFLDADQAVFARLSGDYNPMHMDEVAARRLLAGQKIVHGMHLVLWALEYWLGKYPGVPQGIKCDFKSPVHVGSKVIYFHKKLNSNKSIIRCYAENLLCLKITLLVGSEPACQLESTDELSGADSVFLEKVPEPSDRPAQDQPGRKYKILLVEDNQTGFPYCQLRLGGLVFSALCSLSFFGGMICPGLHSLFSTLDIKLNLLEEGGAYLFYSVDSFDSRFDLFYISVSGVISGEITAFQRPPPVQQASLTTVSTQIMAGEFANTKSLIIGGSRGLGEYTAKLLVAGGGDVILTYAQGLADARRVCSELHVFRAGSCKIQKYNVLGDPVESLVPEDIQSLDAVYFYATPKIFRKKSSLFDKKIFDDFFAIYVLRFYALCSYLESVRLNHIKVFLPSSVAITERPDHLAEYAMAKMSSELLAEEMNKSYSRVSVIVSRLPRLDTDQTATILKVASASTLDNLLPVIRSMQHQS
jgi:hypothetical protein